MLYKENLQNLQCASPHCDHTSHDSQMFFHGKCHPEADVECAYDQKSNALVVNCSVCKKPIAEIAVASRRQEKHEELYRRLSH